MQVDIDRLTEVVGLGEVKFSFVPFVALGRMLGCLEGERAWAKRLEKGKGESPEVEGVNELWRVKAWLE